MNKAEFYTTVKAEITRVNTDIKKVYRFRAQLGDPEQESPLSYPCVLVEFSAIDYQTTTSGQRGRGNVVFHVVTKDMNPESTTDLTISDTFHKSVNRKFGLVRVSEDSENHGPITDWTIQYNTNIFD